MGSLGVKAIVATAHAQVLPRLNEAQHEAPQQEPVLGATAYGVGVATVSV